MTPTSSIAQVPYTGGQSLYFNSANSQYINIPSINLTDPYTVCTYFYISGTIASNQYGPAVFQFSVATPRQDWIVFYDNGYGDTFYRFRTSVGGTFVGDVSFGTVVSNTWTHFCVSWNGQRGFSWVNGQPSAVNAVPTGGTLLNRNLVLYTSNFLGKTYAIGGADTNFLNGYVDEFMQCRGPDHIQSPEPEPHHPAHTSTELYHGLHCRGDRALRSLWHSSLLRLWAVLCGGRVHRLHHLRCGLFCHWFWECDGLHHVCHQHLQHGGLHCVYNLSREFVVCCWSWELYSQCGLLQPCSKPYGVLPLQSKRLPC